MAMLYSIVQHIGLIFCTTCHLRWGQLRRWRKNFSRLSVLVPTLRQKKEKDGAPVDDQDVVPFSVPLIGGRLPHPSLFSGEEWDSRNHFPNSFCTIRRGERCAHEDLGEYLHTA
jgi:hypothetical protein